MLFIVRFKLEHLQVYYPSFNLLHALYKIMNMRNTCIYWKVDCLLAFLNIDPPVISRLSPQQGTWVSGSDGKLQVLFEGGFPEPSAIWTRQLTDYSQQETLLVSGNDFLFTGQHSLNLTVTSLTPTDAGNYSITVFNYLGNVTLSFRIDVIGTCMHALKINQSKIAKS